MPKIGRFLYLRIDIYKNSLQLIIRQEVHERVTCRALNVWKPRSKFNSFRCHLFVDGTAHWVVPGFECLWKGIVFNISGSTRVLKESNWSTDMTGLINFNIFFEADIWVFPNWSRTFIEFNDFSEFRESDKSLKHKLGSIQRSCLSHMSCCLKFSYFKYNKKSVWEKDYFFGMRTCIDT